MPSQFDLVYKVDRTTVLNADVLNVRFRNLDNRLVALEALNISWQAALAVVQDKVLAASELVIASLRDQLVEVTQLDWLIAGSATTVTLALDATLALVILPDDRALFAPGPFSVVSDATDPTVYAVVKTLSYSRDIGQYNFQVLSVAGSPVANGDWQIAAVAGSTLAQLDFLTEGRAARDEVAANTAQVAADTVAVQRINDRFTVSTLAPSGGQDGDIWLKV